MRTDAEAWQEIDIQKELGMTTLTIREDNGYETIIAMHQATNLIQIFPPDWSENKKR